MKLKDLNHNSKYFNIYTHVFPDGSNIHIAATMLRQWCLVNNPEIVLTPVKKELRRILRETNAVNLKRVRKLTPAQRSEPVLFCIADFENEIPSVLLVDGHHRYYRAIIDGDELIKSWVLTPGEWTPFIIEDLPSITHEEMVSCDTSLNRTYWKD